MRESIAHEIRLRFAAPTILASLTLALSLAAQSPNRSLVKPPDIEFLYPEQVSIAANQPTKVVLHFRVGEGLHINSHEPREKFLIPTTFSIPESSGVHLEDAVFPPGTDLTLPSDPNDKLSVYTGEFTIETRLTASSGDHLVEGKLHYQACTNAVCLPPKNLTVAIDVVGK
jgi:DsbC/DsbD-like thiol-disulfide interchange protein